MIVVLPKAEPPLAPAALHGEDVAYEIARARRLQHGLA